MMRAVSAARGKGWHHCLNVCNPFRGQSARSVSIPGVTARILRLTMPHDEQLTHGASLVAEILKKNH